MSPSAGVGAIGQPPSSRLTNQQLLGFLGCYLGWVMDGVDSFIFALVLVPSLRELLPASGRFC